MELTQDTVNKWLTDTRGRQGRHWLAEKLGSGKKTVDNWLSSARGIPAHAQREIERLMAEDRAAEVPQEPAPPMSLVLEVDPVRFDAYNRAALSEKAIMRDWAIMVLDRAAARDIAAGMDIAPVNVSDFPRKDDGPKYWLELHGGIAAGERISAVVHPEPIPVNRSYPEGTYALRVFGTSMEKEGDPRSIPDGSLIAVRAMKNPGYPKQGATVAYSDGMGSTLKIFGYRKAQPSEMEFANRLGDIPVLSSLNPDFPEIQTMDGGRIDAIFVEIIR